jgi:hypothetical protein
MLRAFVLFVVWHCIHAACRFALQSRSDFMTVAVGFNPRFATPAEYPSRSDG